MTGVSGKVGYAKRKKMRRSARRGSAGRGTGKRGKGMPPTPDLRFGPSTDRVGFTPAGIAAFSDLRPEAVVRELIQNSLDAALIEADEPCAYVRFRRSKCTSKDIPGIQSYREAFRRAVSENHPPPGVARAVVERIERALASDTHEVLSVTDNGVGLDDRRVLALLSDGISAKGGNASGTFGNGHSVVVPASNLRYVLYGGVTAQGNRFGGGQAVLASHNVDSEPYGRSGRGLYVVSFKHSGPGVPFTLARDEALPPLVAREVSDIRERHGHGAAVVIPAFNNFEHEQSLWQAVSRAAAFHFFQAIHEGKLVVEVEDEDEDEDEDGGGVLDDGTLRGTLEAYRDEKRARSGGGSVSGLKANEAYKTLVEGGLHEIPTSEGNVAVRLLRRDTGWRGVGLCRNGMWITDNLPRFRKAFTDRQPFQALILLGADSGDGFYGLIREAETPLHDRLALPQMEPESRKKLRIALKEIREELGRLVPEIEGDSYSPEDILTFQFSDVEGQGRGGRQPSFWGKLGSSRRPMVVERKGEKGKPGSGPVGGGGPGRRRRKTGRVLVEPIFRIASVPARNGRRTVHVECTKDFEDAELRMFVDENVDATCDRQTRAQAVAMRLSKATVNGDPVAENALVKHGDDTIGVKLGSLAADAQFMFEADCTVPDDAIGLLRGQEPAVRIEILSSRGANPRPGAPEGGEKAAGD